MNSPQPISRIERGRCCVAALLGIAVLCGPNFAMAADASGGPRARIQRTEPAPRGVIVERRTLPQIAPGGTVVLRGSPSANSNVGQLAPAPSGEGFGSSNPPVRGPAPGAGGGSGLDASGMDRSGLFPEKAPP